MNHKRSSRLRRAKRTRVKIRELGINRLCVHRTLKHIYAQVISADGHVLTQSSTLSLRDTATGNIEAASRVGTLIGQRATEIGIQRVAFDRSGFKYHGRVKALAEAARAAGLNF